MTDLKIKIDPELSTLFENLRGWDYDELKKDIELNGIRIPIEVAEDGTLIEGHQRYRVWTELGRDPADIPMNVKHYASRKAMKDTAITLNILRRHLNNAQRAWIALTHYLPEEKEKAEKRVGGRPKKGEKPPAGKQEVSDKPHTREAYTRAAEHVGLSGRTLRKAEEIFTKSPEKLTDEILKEQKTINSAYNELRIVENRAAAHLKGTPDLPEGIYDVILADPPWKYVYTGSRRGVADVHYKTLSDEELIELPLGKIIAKDAILFLWATNPKLEDALKIANEWGFTYKTCMVWIKPHFGTGFYVRSQHEILLICKKGKLPVPNDNTRPPSILAAPKTKHSEKPAIFYDIIERMFPNRRYLELFARNTRSGWTSWGMEV